MWFLRGRVWFSWWSSMISMIPGSTIWSTKNHCIIRGPVGRTHGQTLLFYRYRYACTKHLRESVILSSLESIVLTKLLGRGNCHLFHKIIYLLVEFEWINRHNLLPMLNLWRREFASTVESTAERGLKNNWNVTLQRVNLVIKEHTARPR